MNQGWKVDVVDFNEGTSGGYKEIIFEVSEDVYGTMKFEAGVHRVHAYLKQKLKVEYIQVRLLLLFARSRKFDIELDMTEVRSKNNINRAWWSVCKYDLLCD